MPHSRASSALRADIQPAQHVVADPTRKSNDISFSSAAWNLLRMSQVDSEIFAPPIGGGEAVPGAPESEAIGRSVSLQPLRKGLFVRMHPPTAPEQLPENLNNPSFPTASDLQRAALDELATKNSRYLALTIEAQRCVAEKLGEMSAAPAPPQDDTYGISIVPLGTGSAIPSKYRNGERGFFTRDWAQLIGAHSLFHAAEHSRLRPHAARRRGGHAWTAAPALWRRPARRSVQDPALRLYQPHARGPSPRSAASARRLAGGGSIICWEVHVCPSLTPSSPQNCPGQTLYLVGPSYIWLHLVENGIVLGDNIRFMDSFHLLRSRHGSPSVPATEYAEPGPSRQDRWVIRGGSVTQSGRTEADRGACAGRWRSRGNAWRSWD